MEPVVSVIVPAYNTKPYIARALTSVLDQTFADFEIIVVDDASTDGTADVARSLGDPRVRVLTSEVNRGAAVARNHALREARGRWISLLDSDDWYGPRRLETLVTRAEATQADLYADDILLVRGEESQPWSSLLRESGQRVERPFVLDPVGFVATDIYGERSLRLGLSKPLMRRSFLVGHGLEYDPALRMGQDFWLYLECLVRGARFIVDPEGHYHYYSRPDSLVKQSQVHRLELYCEAARAFLHRPEVALRPDLGTAIRRSLRIFQRNLAYYRVVEPLKRGEFVTALAAVACNPRCVVQACVRCQRAFTQRWAESQATAPVPPGFQRAASGDAA